MKQTGTVVEINGNTAKVECSRQSACDMCENAENCAEKCKKVYATALNTVNAVVGDMVEIETDTTGVLAKSFAVFILPIFFAVAAFFGINAFFGEDFAVIGTFAVLVFSMVLIAYLLNRSAKRRVVSRVVKILPNVVINESEI
ncbi:MAG: SoxR reducing system RseC family protein [Clostridia bacterium]|nr:SoxR reducing system RseC family protein [Clostridia bacterium]